MSGLVAIFERDGAPVAPALLEAHLARVAHRGPDRRVTTIAGEVGLGHALLATTPQDAHDRQPATSLDGAVHVLFDGRLDNRVELWKTLGFEGFPAPHTPDAALVVRAYQRHGEAFAAELVGDFAIVVWDQRLRTLFAVRDALGVRPLFFHEGARHIAFASEPHALFADPRTPRDLSPEQIALFVMGEYLERDATLYAGIAAVPPGHTLIVSRTSRRLARHWAPENVAPARNASEADASARFRVVLEEAVRCRLRSITPGACHVSGGLDSTSVAIIAEDLRRRGEAHPEITWMRLVFPGLSCDESAFSDAAARAWGRAITSLDPLAAGAALTPSKARHDIYYEPTLRASELMYGEAQRLGARVMLTGLGGDTLLSSGSVEIASALRRGALREALGWAPRDHGLLSLQNLRLGLSQAATAFAPPAALRAWRSFRRARAAAQQGPATLVRPAIARRAHALIDARDEAIARRFADPGCAFDAAALEANPSTTLALSLQDRTAALYQAEPRHPFFDVRVVEALLGLPRRLRFRPTLDKCLLRDAMGTRLPDIVKERTTKAEFDVFAAWTLKTAFRETSERIFARAPDALSDIVDLGLVRAAFQGPTSLNWQPWLSLALWLEQNDPDAPPTSILDQHPAPSPLPNP